ncbi:hypothetical protein GOEFS_073_00640 [Gordonia effusa NBRC 100432]|uniref:DUF998 domain-containing protein n=1 Tax=Gordonia effusa NBRC 100432 TaxID=1077974 RepID=H0R1U3_9ACTN|nr:hypothetical protein GOEFS_073_00640 [Gordonia effusa NBRC 100432]
MSIDSPRQYSVRRWVAAVAIGVAGLCYSSWALEHLWAGGLDPMRTFLSELDAAGRPHRGIYVAGDIITAVAAMVAMLVLLLPRPAVRGYQSLAAVIAFGCFGAATLADALMPIECIPGVDVDCPWEPSGIFPQLHHVHALTSSLAVISLFTAIVAATLASFTTGRWRLLRVVGSTIFGVIMVSTAWMLIADNLSGDYRLGLAQRIQVGAMSVWMLVWAVALVRERRSP